MTRLTRLSEHPLARQLDPTVHCYGTPKAEDESPLAQLTMTTLATADNEDPWEEDERKC